MQYSQLDYKVSLLSCIAILYMDYLLWCFGISTNMKTLVWYNFISAYIRGIVKVSTIAFLKSTHCHIQQVSVVSPDNQTKPQSCYCRKPAVDYV